MTLYPKLSSTADNLYKQLVPMAYRRVAENGFAPPPLGNFADISYLVEN